MKEEVQEIFIDQIDDPANAMRTELNRDGLHDLADNIKQNGLINPITVRPKNGRFEVVAGHRRFSACKIAGKIRIQCIVRDLTDDQAFEVMAAENLERADVDVVDEAIFIAQFIDRTGKTPAEVAKSLRRSISYVETRLLVGQMPDYMRVYLKEGSIKIGVALALMEITDDPIRHAWVDMAARDGVSAAQARYWVDGWKLQTLPGGIRSETPPGDFTPSAPQVVQFECAITGKKYDARLCRTIMVGEENLPFFYEVVKAIQTPPVGV